MPAKVPTKVPTNVPTTTIFLMLSTNYAQLLTCQIYSNYSQMSHLFLAFEKQVGMKCPQFNPSPVGQGLR